MVVFVATACSTRPDPLFCDELTPCQDPARPFCDLTGSYPASDGVARTCIPDPDSLPDGGVGGDGGGDGDGNGSCTLSQQCPDQAPICSSGQCGACEPAASSAECSERDPGTPACSADGLCVECTRRSDCSG